jgi:hypothetical protein
MERLLSNKQGTKREWKQRSSLPCLFRSVTPDDEFDVFGPPRIGYFRNEENLDEEAVFVKNGALVLAHHSGIYMSKQGIDEYSLLYLQFVFTYRFDVALAYNTLIYHIFDNAHETCVDVEVYHKLACAIICLPALSFICRPEKKDDIIKERMYYPFH